MLIYYNCYTMALFFLNHNSMYLIVSVPFYFFHAPLHKDCVYTGSPILIPFFFFFLYCSDQLVCQRSELGCQCKHSQTHVSLISTVELLFPLPLTCIKANLWSFQSLLAVQHFLRCGPLQKSGRSYLRFAELLSRK